MSPAQWQRVQELFECITQLPPTERQAYLERSEPDETVRMEALHLAASSAEEQEASRQVRIEDRPASSLPASGLPASIGSVTISSIVGSGGFSTVYSGVRHVSGAEQLVAVKVFHQHRLGPDAHRRLMREQRLLASLNHPGIVRFLDAGVTAEEQPYLVMELVSGVTITDHCDRYRLDLDERLRLIADVCRALQFAHRSLVVHLDLKPSNILVTADGQVKVLDFGTAKLMNDTGSPTVTQQITPMYASPERLRGEPGSVSSDVYSLGLVLYEVVSGSWPFADADSIAGIAGRVNGSIEATPLGANCTAEAAAARGVTLDRLRRNLEGDLRSIATKALALAPAERYGSMSELLEDLRRLKAGEPVLAHPPGLAYRTRKFLTRNGRPLAAAGVAIAMLGAAGGYAYRERLQGAQRLQEARGMANYLLFDLYDQVAELPGSTAVRARMAAQAQAQLDNLARLSGADPALRIEAAAGYDRLAEVQAVSGSSSLGNIDAAAANLLRARVILDETLASRPGLRSALLEQARNAMFSAKLENWNRRNAPAARPLIEKARVLLGQTRDLSDPGWLRAHASLALQQSDLAHNLGNYDEETSVSGEALRELETWPESMRSGADYALLRVAMLKRSGNGKYERKIFADALADYGKAYQIVRQFDAAHPNRPEILYALMDMRYQMAYSFGELKQPQAMLDATRESLAIARRLADADRENHALERSYWNKRQALAESLAGLRRFGEAAREGQAVLEARLARSQAEPASNLAREDVLVAGTTLAEIHLQAGDRGQACPLARDYWDRSRALHDAGAMTPRLWAEQQRILGRILGACK
ncbi:MAG: serine/threonine-protein kinase [Bryobacteraceae bacterium]